MKKSVTILFLLIYSSVSLLAGNIVYPWRSTTAIVKSGETFEVWFNASAGQAVNSIILKGPYNAVNATITSTEINTWVYDQWSGNTYNQKITVTVSLDTPADRYDLVLKTSTGDEISLASVKVIKEYKDSYYIMHISDAHRWQGTYDTPNVILREISTIIDIANIIDPEILVETGDGHYPNTNNMAVTAQRIDDYMNGFLLNGSIPVKGLNNAYAPVFMVPGNHDTPQKNYQLEPDMKTPATYWNTYYGLQSYGFNYGEARFVGVNNAWFPDSKGTPNFSHQTDEALAWLTKAGAGNFRVGFCHVPQESIPPFYNPFSSVGTPLDLILCGHVHSVTYSPYAVDNKAIVYTTRTCRDGNAKAPFNLYEVDAKNGTYVPVSTTNGALQALETAKDYNSSKLTLTYGVENNGSNSNNSGTIVNKFDFTISRARIRFVMPKGMPYYITKGIINQEFDGPDYHIVDVRLDLEANSTTTVEIKAGIKPDLCPDDPDKDEPGYCGCSVPEGSCTIHVEEVTLSPASAKLNLFVSRPFTATVVPANATNQALIWSTSNENVARVNADGLVTAVAEGEAIIMATLEDGGMTAVSEVTVLPNYTNYQAEDAEYSGPVLAADQSGYNGSGFLDYTNSSGDYIKWRVYVPSGGTYPLRFRYALAAGNRPLQLAVNDEVRIPSISFPVTGSFQTWMEYTTEQLLNAGTNTITLTAIGSSGGNFDELNIGGSTGINSMDSSEKNVSVYPNPYQDGKLNIHLNGSEDEVFVVIRNLLGQTVFQKKISNSSHEILDVSGKLTDAVYFVLIGSGKSWVVRKLMVQHK
ncbi:MAG: Ig-like domain-containing protein [Bacteroidales bacterium]|nr:Ig-like domain-containing protein [Bacteroidales bacterium]